MDRRKQGIHKRSQLTQLPLLRNRPTHNIARDNSDDSEFTEFQNEYRMALMEYLKNGSDEASLLHAYELGRRAATSQLSVLSLNEIHQSALMSGEFHRSLSFDDNGAYLLGKAADFLGQALAPFDMMHRGYVETISRLRTLNETLHQQSQALRLSEERMRMFIKHNPAAVAMLDRDMRYVLVSPRWRIDYRLGERDILGLSHYEVFPETPREWREIYQRCLGGEVDKRDEVPFQRADGSLDWVRWEIHPWYTGEGEESRIGGIIMFTEVVTERKNQERKIARLSRIQSITSAINAAIIRINDREELMEEVCRVAVEQGRFRRAWVGFGKADALAISAVASQSPANGSSVIARGEASNVLVERSVIARAMQCNKPVVCNDIEHDRRLRYKREFLERGYHSLVMLPLCESGRPIGILCLCSAEARFFDREELRLLSELADDISYALNHIVKEEQINYLAYYDALTSLPNRDLFFDRLQRQIEAARHEGRTIAVLLFDIERFSNVNDTFGRHIGDALLKQVGVRLQRLVSSHDTLAHIGGDVFAIMLADIKDAPEAAHALERLIAGCFTPVFEVGGYELYVAVKAGISLFPGDGADRDTLYKNAEIALKKAQKNGETYLFYRREMNASVARRLTLENRLYRALERGEFVPYYQPKIHTGTDRVVGLECLLRWQQSESELVLPSAFIPILEETGMILPVGAWIMEKAISDYQGWLAQGLSPPPIAVNVSVVQLRHRDFVASLRRIGDKIPSGDGILDLEITESILMENIEQNIEKLRAAKDMGMKIAIDDFGTGYSSLSYLTRLPVDLLKIDRSFVIEMNRSPSGLAIVSSVISLAHSLELGVIAEGVDDEEQAKLLKLLRCDQLQGFYCSKPVSGVQIETMLGKH
ncbi:MAG TPA: EAL domain-containing protein [Noviherbaspirillum sp.]|uniref:putative bifunctional diguanylate cyclase/phosphodiesterase n=1 Tax=Noviherbaspirillum sp. TaxID=1926288 RepID=UPI002B49331D|nr:EAL domain-containing protein [Noviherbaspirillum sp.]HJV87485.1 EAL domain-containing protein [Noviherbaspirillum sp.]